MKRRDELREKFAVPVEKLRLVCDVGQLTFVTTNEVEPEKDFIGQGRAVEALKFGLGVDMPGYNVFATGHVGTGRKAAFRHFLEETNQERGGSGRAILKDFCYIHNADDPLRPKLLIFPRGGGRKFKAQVDEALESLIKTIPPIFSSEKYQRSFQDMRKEFEGEYRRKWEELSRKAKDEGYDLDETPMGVQLTYPSRQNSDQTMSPAEFNQLPQEEREALLQTKETLRRGMEKFSQKAQADQAKMYQKIEALGKELVGKVLEQVFGPISECYLPQPAEREGEEGEPGYPAVLTFFEQLKEFVLKNIDYFKPQEQNQMQMALTLARNNHQDKFLPFRVNLFLDNSKTEAPPIIFDELASFQSMFGGIEKKFVQGAFLTDHSQLAPGSITLAEGGYLVLNILDIFRHAGVWEKLEKTLQTGFLKIEDPWSSLGFASTGLQPEPIPIKLKVIIVGDPMYYHLLVEFDHNFLSIFKVKAEFDSEMPLDPKAYAAFVSFCCQQANKFKEIILAFELSGVARLVEHGARLAGNQKKQSTLFGKIKDLIVEASYWAKQAGSSAVKAEHVKQALDAQRLRLNLAEVKLQEFIKDGMQLLDIQGEEIGQVNGLSVYNLGDYSFGIPSRITAQTFLGKRGVVSIDREVEMSGPIHNKGVQIFSGYFGDKYAKDKPISFSASICFEQSYGGVEGDSASATELYALISSFARLPIKQSIAVTGSVNQKGEIQPIGGVNQKIEGFFDVCNKRGLTGEQGVHIPHQNVQNLMLREDVVEACREGRFHVYAIETVDQGIELLMGLPAAEIHQKVSDCLAEMTKKVLKADKDKEQAPNES